MPSHVHLTGRPRARTLGLLTFIALLPIALFASLALRSHESPQEVITPPTSPRIASSETDGLRFPTAPHLRSARTFAARRLGRVSFAVVDTSGALSCYRCSVPYHSASVIKVMLLVAYLDRLSVEHNVLPADHEADLNSMIRASDNVAASAIYDHVGDKGLLELAERAQMANFHVSRSWGTARITAADQALFLAHLPQLTAPEYQTYVRDLLSSIIPEQSWGIPAVSRPEWNTFFKGGWLASARGSLVHQVARLERGRSSFAIAILTDRNPSDDYGRQTIHQIAERVLGVGP